MSHQIQNELKEKKYTVDVNIRDRAGGLAQTKCRVPVVIRIMAYQILAQYESSPEYEMSVGQKAWHLDSAWALCHTVKTTPIMVELMHKTQQLWGEILGLPLSAMPVYEVKAPEFGYAVFDPRQCFN